MIFIVHSNSRPWPSCKIQVPASTWKDKSTHLICWRQTASKKLESQLITNFQNCVISAFGHLRKKSIFSWAQELLSTHLRFEELPSFFGVIGPIKKLHRKNWCVESNNWTLTCKFHVVAFSHLRVKLTNKWEWEFQKTHLQDCNIQYCSRFFFGAVEDNSINGRHYEVMIRGKLITYRQAKTELENESGSSENGSIA